MFKKPEKLVGHEQNKWLKDLTPSAEKVGFDANQMLACDACQRNNPPTRTDCFYCGAKLSIPEGKENFVRPNLRVLEDWEKGWNVVCLTKLAPFAEREKLREIAYLLRLENEIVEKILSAEKPLPIARTENSAEAETVVKRLAERGIESLVVADEELQVEVLPTRIRTLEFGENELFLVTLGKDEVLRVGFEELNLFVAGTIIETKRETAEKRTKNAENKIVNSTETSADEKVLDFYTDSAENGFRLSTRGFDFSCLEDEKKLLAAENFGILLEKLRQIAPTAEFDESYRNAKNALNAVWHLDETTDTKGLQRAGIGKSNLANVVISSNLTQFTKYSRLQSLIITNSK